jgi:hypothetical protein
MVLLHRRRGVFILAGGLVRFAHIAMLAGSSLCLVFGRLGWF